MSDIKDTSIGEQTPENKRKLVLSLLALFIVLQCLILIGMYLKAQYPLWVGKPIQVAVEPIDPRSLFRGNYAILNYTISQAKFNSELLDKDVDDPRIHQGAVVYTRLKQNKQGLYEPIDTVFDKPAEGVFIRGRLNKRRSWSTNYRIKYGVEAYFAPKARALEIEHLARRRAGGDENKVPAVVTLMLTPSGKAAIQSLEIK